MESTEYNKLTDEELLSEKKKQNKSKIFHALSIGFLVGILIFGVVSWSLASEKHFGFLIPMGLLIGIIYKLLKKPNGHKELEAVLKSRNIK